MKSIMSVDLEYDFEGETTYSLNFIPNLLNFFDDNKIKATFFVLGKLAESHKDLIKEIAKKHEIASHSYSHVNLKKLNEEQLEQEIQLSKEAIEKLNIKCYGFRAPFFMTPPALFGLLEKHGFKYDSSISSFFPGRYTNLLTPTKPFKKNNLIELPIPNYLPKLFAAGLPYYRFFYPISKSFTLKYMFYLHPCEFLDKPIGKEIGFFVRQFYKVNKGKKAWSIFKNLIEKSDIDWTSCIDYIKENKLDS